jgi:SUKH-3 immunity protein
MNGASELGLSHRLATVLSEAPVKPGYEFQKALDKLYMEGYYINGYCKRLVIFLNGRKIIGAGGDDLEFDILHGLGTFDDIQTLTSSIGVSMFPIGTWSAYTIFLGEDEKIYLTDFYKIVRVSGNAVDGLEKLAFKILPDDMTDTNT